MIHLKKKLEPLHYEADARAKYIVNYPIKKTIFIFFDSKNYYNDFQEYVINKKLSNMRNDNILESNIKAIKASHYEAENYKKKLGSDYGIDNVARYWIYINIDA